MIRCGEVVMPPLFCALNRSFLMLDIQVGIKSGHSLL